MALSPVTPETQGSTQTRKLKSIVDLQPEVLIQILTLLPDVDCLKNAVLAHPVFYNAFSGYERSISTAVLKNELPDTYAHAVVEELVSNPQYTGLPSFELTSIESISAYVQEIRNYRDNALNLRVTAKVAVAISRRAKIVTTLCDTLIDDCAYAGDQQYIPLWDSVRYRPVAPSEVVRIQQAIYLFQISGRLCKNWRFANGQDRQYYVDCQDKITELQKCTVEQLMAPWEFHQVLAVQAYFRRALHGLKRDHRQSERTMPDLLSRGIGFMYKALCVVGWQGVDKFIAPFDKFARTRPLHALGMIFSRGIRDTWTRKGPRPYEEYKPFSEDDYLAYQAWQRLERVHLKYFQHNGEWHDFFSIELRILEGYLDLWSAALWNESRWPEIERAIYYEPDFEEDVPWIHWDPIVAGFETIFHPDLAI